MLRAKRRPMRMKRRRVVRRRRRPASMRRRYSRKRGGKRIYKKRAPRLTGIKRVRSSVQKDNYPQFLHYTQDIAASFNSSIKEIALPIPKLKTGGTKMIEVLRIEFIPVAYKPLFYSDPNNDVRFAIALLPGSCTNSLPPITTTDFNTVDSALKDNRCFCGTSQFSKMKACAIQIQEDGSYLCELDRNTGKGYLIAADKLTSVMAFGNSAGGTVSGTFTCNVKMLYRFVEANVNEYVGLLQQQD